MAKRMAVGVVMSDKTAKTRRVELPRQVRHPKYGKILHRKTICYVHDEQNESKHGDTVEIRECPAEVGHQAVGVGADRGQEHGGGPASDAGSGQAGSSRESRRSGRRDAKGKHV